MIKRVNERVSANCDDPGYHAYRALAGNNAKVVVMVDGKEIDNCITADPEQGFALCLRNDNQEIATETLLGTVEVLAV